MKISVYTDLHIDKNKKVDPLFINKFIGHVIKNKTDILLITGDIHSYAKQTKKIIQEIKKSVKCPVYFVPGNHDIWDEENSWSSYELLEKMPECLSGKIIPLNEEFVLIGDLGWYDYTFNRENFDIELIKEKSLRGSIWLDKFWAKWGMEDPEVSNLFLEKLTALLEQVKDKKVIFMTHVVPFEDLLENRDVTYNFFHNFIGSARIGELILKHPNIEYAFCGHTHYRSQTIKNNTQVICNPLGYGAYGEWVHSDVEEELDLVGFHFSI